ncbi:MAG: ATP-binding protein [Solirubrobacteraceae bacterium]
MPRVVDLFPTGGPVDPELMIGRAGELEDLVGALGEGISVALVGPRRIGKTTLGAAACAALEDQMTVLPRIEVPDKRQDCSELLGLVIARYFTRSSSDELAEARGVLGKFFRGTLKDHAGLELPEAEGGEQEALTSRQALELLAALADETRRPVLVFFDELQRVADAADYRAFLGDIVDVFAGGAKVVVLADGSDDRLQYLLDDPDLRLDKLLPIMAPGWTIARAEWRDELLDRFAELKLPISPQDLEQILDLGAGAPFPTMVACQEVAMAARQLQGTEVDQPALTYGLAAARDRMKDA